MIWNGGGGTLSGTVSAPAPFSIVSGASFSLLPGQPQEVVVRFSSATAGSFSKSVSISSNGGSATVTATGVAHKVSFSPAQVDFGSGLLVLREQCNKMGMCGLGTEKVRLPIEKALTIKNEGTVAVSLTLSTAAPYKVVSAAPSLAPGQSGQVVVRFDPSESGSFSGAVQVGITGGQGSVTSPPLVGVAHKIEVSKKQLDFGIAFVNSTEYQRLTIKNQGVTTVSLIVSVTAPFTIVSGNPFTLTPGQSSEVVVGIHPTMTGSISGTVRLTSGSMSFEMPARARVMTYEEYAEAMLGALNSLTNLGYYGITYAWDNTGTVPREVLLAGFQNLDQSQIEHWLAMTESWESSPDPGQQEMDPRLQEAMNLLNSIDPSVLGWWLQELADAMTDNRFDEVYNTLLPQGLDKVEQALLLILDSQDPQDAKDLLVNFIGTLQQSGVLLEQPSPPQADLFQLWVDILTYLTRPPLAMGPEEAKDFADAFVLNLANAYRAIASYLGQNSAEGRDLADNFLAQVKAIVRHIINNYDPWDKLGIIPVPLSCGPGCRLLKGLSGLMLYGGMLQYPRHAELTYGSVNILYNVIQPGNPNDPFDKPWTLIGIVGVTGEPFNPLVDEDFFLVERIKGIPGRSNITIVARGDHCSVCISYDEIVDWIKQALYVLEDQIARTAPLPGIIQDRGIIIYVFTNPSAIGTDQALQAIEEYVGSLPPKVQDATAILVVRVMPNRIVQYKCVGKGCSMYTPEELKKMACKQATGRAACVAEPWPQQSQPPSNPENQEQPDSGIIEEPDWDETEPIDPNTLPEPRCPICNG